MPTSIATVTVIALAIIPGAFGAYVWALINGQDWREKDWEAAIRFLAFSVLGLGVYVLLGLIFTLPPAIHILPSTYGSAALNAPALSSIFSPYIGHIMCSGLVGAAAAVAHRWTASIRGASPQPSTWDHFIKSAVPKHWVVVTLKSGDVYAGYVQTAEESAPATERDIILRHPAKFNEAINNYCVTSLQDLFVPAELVQSLGTVRSESELLLDPAVNTLLFPKAST
ncbi:MAG TPA: DUF6338 family protein [Gemmatimonadales bacterium]|nr:DUF6338 family protein [Gemmatimonadales bacterium]